MNEPIKIDWFSFIFLNKMNSFTRAIAWVRTPRFSLPQVFVGTMISAMVMNIITNTTIEPGVDKFGGTVLTIRTYNYYPPEDDKKPHDHKN